MATHVHTAPARTRRSEPAASSPHATPPRGSQVPQDATTRASGSATQRRSGVTGSRAEVAQPQRWASRIVGEADVDPRTLIPNPQNWRKHPHAQQVALDAALDEIGWIQRIIVNKTTGHMIDGHLRVERALTKKERSVPVSYVELSAEEERIALATFDPLSALATTDQNILDALMRDIGRDNAVLVALLAQDDPAITAAGSNQNTSSQLSGMEFRVVIDCVDEMEQTELLERFQLEGRSCRALIS